MNDVLVRILLYFVLCRQWSMNPFGTLFLECHFNTSFDVKTVFNPAIMAFRSLRSLARSSSAHRYQFRTVAFAGGVGCIVGVTSVVGTGES